jgi:predicted Rossmann fold nucleotide-binding protein DprA/Smf involved in DNA uptake
MIREPALRAAAANINTKARDRLRMGIVERLVVLETPTNGGEDIAVSCARCHRGEELFAGPGEHQS